MRVEWDDSLNAWVADASASRSGSDTTSGPAGPAGVAALHRGGATVSFCTMTGRITSLWFDPEPEGEARALLGAVTDPLSTVGVGTGPGRVSIDIDVVPLIERLDLVRLAMLEDTAKRVRVAPGSVAELFVLAETAAVARRVERSHPGLMGAGAVAAARAAAERAASAFGYGPLTDQLPDRVRFDAEALVPALSSIADDLAEGETATPLIRLLRDTVRGLVDGGRTCPVFLGGRHGAAAPARGDLRVAPVAHPELFAPDVIINPGPPEDSSVTLVVPVHPDGSLGPLGDLAPRQLGFAAEGASVSLDGAWCTVTVPMTNDARHPAHRWVVCSAKGKPVGAAPFAITEGAAAARFAVTTRPDECSFGGHPLRRSAESSIRDDLEAVDRLSRAAWWASQLHRPEARTWIARAAIGWFDLGQVFRAGWAWSVSDQQFVEELLTGRVGDTGREIAVAAMRAVAESGDVPDQPRDVAVPVPAWVHAVDLAEYASRG